jgi:hypothetical protein
MTRTSETRARGLRRSLIAGAVGTLALGIAAAPALADVVVYGSSGYYVAPTTVYTPAPAYTYTYTAPTYTYSAPVYTYVPRGPGIYLDTPAVGFGIGFH